MFAGYNLVFGAISGLTDNAAHIGGLVSGLILGALIARVAPDRSDVTRRLTVLVVVALAVAGGTAWLYSARGYPVHTQRGIAFLQQKRLDQGIAELERAIRQRPDDLLAHLALGQAYFTKGQFAEATAQWTQAIKLNPEIPGVHYNLGLAHAKLQKYDEAIAAFRKEQEVGGDSYDLEIALADAYRAKGMQPQADEAMRKAAELKAQP
jgi:tetratricopeptide (TPR) repeat protein